MKPFALGILGSGAGTNCRAILEAIASGALTASVPIIASDNPDAGILGVAKEFGILGTYFASGKFRTKMEPGAEAALVVMLRAAGVQTVVLAGFMRILSSIMLEAFPNRILNIHPSLLPRYPGLEAWSQALAAGETTTGCTVHYVDSGVDTGNVIARKEVPILAGDTPESLHKRIQAAERLLYPTVLQNLCLKWREAV